MLKKLVKGYGLALFGTLVYSASLNLIIMPYGFFSATFTGIAQIINSLLREFAHLPIPESFNMVGVILALMNLPLLLLAVKTMGGGFSFRTVVMVGVMTIAMSIIPIPKTPLIDNELTASLMGGLLCGFGAGLTLRAGASTGGVDILGLYFAKKYPGFSVGRISLIVGAVVYAYSFIKYDLNTVIYSAIYTVVFSLTVDKTHYQNIKASAIIFSRKREVIDYIIHTLKRGATCWEGYGAYSGEVTHICMTVVSKYEVAQLRRQVMSIDPKAFIVMNDRLDVTGNYESRLS